MEKLGYKQITKENWLLPDKISTSFLVRSPNGELTEIKNGEIYLEMILKPRLDENVPLEVQRLYEVARGVLIYGYFFYPLYTLGCEQLFRVAEAALSVRCRMINPHHEKETFRKKIEYLGKQGLLNEPEMMRWNALRQLRNISSHPADQSIYPPGPVISFLSKIADDINSLFSKNNPSTTQI